ADLHAFALGADDDALRMARIDQHGVDDPVKRSHALPLIGAFVGCFPESAGGSGIERLRILGILANQLCAAIDERDAAVTLPVLLRVRAAVDAGGSLRVLVRRI